jgi:hypothetical protein
MEKIRNGRQATTREEDAWARDEGSRKESSRKRAREKRAHDLRAARTRDEDSTAYDSTTGEPQTEYFVADSVQSTIRRSTMIAMRRFSTIARRPRERRHFFGSHRDARLLFCHNQQTLKQTVV